MLSREQDKVGNLVYAIGGTGAKCAEALVHLTAAGVIDTDWCLRIVDQDRDNGNGSRLVRLVAFYNDVQRYLRRGVYALDNDNPIMRARITHGNHIMPVLPNIEAVLREAFDVGEAPDPSTDGNALLLHALYTDEERSERLVRGFAGRPGLGAAAFLCPQSEEKSELWASVRDDVRLVTSGQIDHILLLGSMFGGTGAAGLPTLGRHFRAHINDQRTALGAVLCLRYFDLDNAGRFKPADHSRTRAAMMYYAGEMMPEGGSALFDELYLVGLDPEITIPAEQTGGGKGQINPALLPELIAGLGAARFQRSSPLPAVAGAPVSRSVFLCGREKPDTVGWDDLPIADLRLRQGDTRDLLVGMGRFAIAYTYAFHCGRRLSEVPYLEDLPAYQRFLNIAAAREGEYDEEGLALVRLCEMYLEWFGACNLMEPSGLRLQLADVANLVACTEGSRPYGSNVALSCDVDDIVAGNRRTLRQVKDAYRGLHRKGRRYQLHDVATGMLAMPAARTPAFSRFIDALYANAARLSDTSDKTGAR
jgi:hypothetical protein